MWIIILALAIGVVAGAFLPVSDRHRVLNARLQHAGVVVLLFFMGVSIGLNKELLRQWRLIGKNALLYGLLTTLFSVVAVALVTALFFRSSREKP